MRILIVSDTHGNHRNLDRVLEKIGAIDGFLHLGDVEGDEDYFEALLKCPVHIVAGNNDFFSDLPDEKMLQIGKYKIMMNHGHGYYVSRNTSRLKKAAKDRGADIVMYGHTHRPDIDFEDGIITINPGSLSYPRQERRRPTYIMMYLRENGAAEFELHEI